MRSWVQWFRSRLDDESQAALKMLVRDNGWTTLAGSSRGHSLHVAEQQKPEPRSAS